MPKRKIQFQNGIYYHVFNRGFLKYPIFKNQQNKERFINKARHYSKILNISIESNAILSNHYHFLLLQEDDAGTQNRIQKFITRLQLSFANYYNKKLKRRGQVFEGRFKATPIKDKWHYMDVFNYVMKNPWKHEMEHLANLAQSKISSGTQKN